RLSVKDTGVGMDEQTLKKAIEPFFSTKPTGKGTGLGLSSVHGLATQLGGKFDLKSSPGCGTTATLWLPEAEDLAIAPEFERTKEAESPPQEKVATILVVDDDPLIATSTVDMLEDLGHTVIGANSAREALEIIDAGRPLDLLMTDHAMPGMTGLQLAEIVRQKRPALPILLATGYAEMPEGAIPLPRLSKPYQQAQLNEQINRLLAKDM
ncbi:MAG: response regulator, partial [Pseudomonadota bacterium]|nr:response regulator [Pseudomonadota bacterium]